MYMSTVLSACSLGDERKYIGKFHMRFPARQTIFATNLFVSIFADNLLSGGNDLLYGLFDFFVFTGFTCSLRVTNRSNESTANYASNTVLSACCR